MSSCLVSRAIAAYNPQPEYGDGYDRNFTPQACGSATSDTLSLHSPMTADPSDSTPTCDRDNDSFNLEIISRHGEEDDSSSIDVTSDHDDHEDDPPMHSILQGTCHTEGRPRAGSRCPRREDQQILSKIPKAFHAARDADLFFEHLIQQDEKDHTSTPAPSDRIPSEAVCKVYERWFIGEEHLEDRYYGLEPLNDIPESVHDQKCARFSPQSQTASSPEPSSQRPPRFVQQNKRLIANISHVASGQYALYLRVKVVDDEPTTLRFTVRTMVRYTAGRMDDISYTHFVKSLEKDSADWHYLKAHCQVEVRPHLGNALVRILIEHDDKFADMRGKLNVRSLELVPIEQRPLHAESVFSPTIQRSFTLDTQPSVDAQSGHSNAKAYVGNGGYLADPGAITRMTTSKNGDFLAFLTVFSHRIKVQVWNKNKVQKHIRDTQTANDDLHEAAAIITLDLDKNARDLPLELVISASGDYIAIFETPRIGDWYIGGPVTHSNLGVCLFRNPLSRVGDHSSLKIEEGSMERLLEPLNNIPRKLRTAVGYATFAGGTPNDSTRPATRFVYCNGLNLDIYDVHRDSLAHSHTIPLSNRISPLPRTIACELLIASITTNMFIWVDDIGRYCSTWDLSNGSALGRFEVAGLQYGNRAGSPIMLVTCNHNTIAILGFDNSITTVDASTGIKICRRVFKLCLIEHIAFPSAQSEMLFVKLRRGNENVETTMVVDPLRLDVEVEISSVPPLSRLSVFGYLDSPEYRNCLGIIFRPDGDLIHAFTCESPVLPIGARKYGPQKAPEACLYDIKTVMPTLPNGAEDWQEPCKIQIEIWKKARPGDHSPVEPVFSFIPEPWELHGEVQGSILPTGDRFMVHACWTIQIWSLPTRLEPQCKLLFFWSDRNKSAGKKIYGKTDMEVILNHHRRFDNLTWIEHNAGPDQTQLHANVVFPEGAESIYLPNSPMRLADHREVTMHCIESIWLLALAHTIVTSGYQNLPPIEAGKRYHYHAAAIMDFVDRHINHSIPSGDEKESHLTIWTQLMSVACPKEFGAKFIATYLKKEYCRWVPRLEPVKYRPLEVAIDRRVTIAVQAILEYGTRKAKEGHPAYMLPIEQSFCNLWRPYPRLLQAVFRNASYIPANRDDFNHIDVRMATIEWDAIWRQLISWVPSVSQSTLQTHKDPVLTLQLGERCTISLVDKQDHKFNEIPDPKLIEGRDDYRMFVAPFPSYITLGPGSHFHKISGKDCFDSPALLAILQYKWWQYGLIYWTFRYSILLLFYGIFTAMTISQMRRSQDVEIPKWIQDYFMEHCWLGLIIVDIVLGCLLMVFEMIQLWHDSAYEYLGTFFNYIDMGSILSCIICLCVTVHEQWTTRGDGDSPQQFSFTSYAIIAMYLHVIVELRVFRPMGIIVNIIFQIMKRIRAFFVVFTLMVVGFTHGMVYLLYVYQAECDEATGCKRPDTAFPWKTFPAFATTFFFLAGRYDPVDDDFSNERFSFLLLMVLFYFLCSIILLTVLIAQVTDAYSDAFKDGERAWRRQLSETLAEAEMVGKFLRSWKMLVPASWRRASRPVPSIIYYMAQVEAIEGYTEDMKERKHDASKHDGTPHGSPR